MTAKLRILVYAVIYSVCFFHLVVTYDIPKARIEVFHPKGFEVSIPADQGVTLFAFHGKLNQEMEGLEAGTWSRDIVKANNGRFTFRDQITKLQIGDVLYYWTYAIYNRLGYREDNGKYIVSHYSNHSDSNHRKCSSCDESITTVNGVKVECKDQLIFQENFDGCNLNSTVWQMENRYSTEPDFEFVRYYRESRALCLTNGRVVIKPIKSNETDDHDFGKQCTGEQNTEQCVRNRNAADIVPAMISAQFSSKPSFNFLYGKIEIRAKLPKAAWAFPQIWLHPSSFVPYGKDNYASGQMRIAFIQGDDGCRLSGGVLLTALRPLRTFKLCSYICSRSTDWTADFHVYSLEWRPDAINVSVDGEQYCNLGMKNGFYDTKIGNTSLPNAAVLKSVGSKLAPFDKEFHIRIGYGIGGNYDFDDTMPDKPWNNFSPTANTEFWSKMSTVKDWLNSEDSNFEIDYIKVYSV